MMETNHMILVLYLFDKDKSHAPTLPNTTHAQS